MTSRRKSALITGGTGLLGQALCAAAPADWSIATTHLRSYHGGIPDVLELNIDTRDRPALDRLFAERRFDAVVHAAGVASVDYSERYEDESTASNLGGTRNIAELCSASDTRLVYISTNAVFDGTHAPYREGDPVNPVNAYGRIKVACERLVNETLERSAIVRPILMYGWSHPMGRPNPATWVIDALERGETLHVVDDVFENPVHNICAARAIWAILELDATGVVHVAGQDVVSRYEFAQMVARIFDLDGSRIRPVPSSFFPDIAPRPRNTSLVTDRMRSELGVTPSSVEQGLRLMATRVGVRG